MEYEHDITSSFCIKLQCWFPKIGKWQRRRGFWVFIGQKNYKKLEISKKKKKSKNDCKQSNYKTSELVRVGLIN